ncbi:hypothetical protein C4J81_16140 [Deltaproteobacteria bacterium Smac51]|nr:hypothetical protein C4J81_16140 [Deltaproteobacteria bacterium Smac51]
MTFVLQKLGDFGALANWPRAAVPILAQINEHIPQLCQLPHDYLLRDDPESMAECTLLVYEYYDVSLLIANLDAYNFEAESMGQKISYATGRYPDIDRSDYLIKDKNDLDKIKFGGLESGRYPYLLKYVKAFRKYAGCYPASDACAPWSLAANIYGLDRLALSAISDPGFTHEMLRRIIYDFMVPLYRAQLEVLPERRQYDLADAFASPPLVSPKIFRDYVVRYYDELCRAFEGADITFGIKGIWGVGVVPEKNREQFTDDLVHVTGGTLGGMDPDVANIGPQWYRDYADRKKVPMFLGLMTKLLEDGPVEAIVERVKHYTLTGKNGLTPFVFFLSNVAPATPSEHVHAAVQAVRTFGQPEADSSTSFQIKPRESFGDFVAWKKSNNPEGYSFKWLERSGLGR